MLLRDFIEDRVCDKCLVKPCSAASDSSVRDEVERLLKEIEELKKKTSTTRTGKTTFLLLPTGYRLVRYQPGGDSDLPTQTFNQCYALSANCPFDGEITSIDVRISGIAGYDTNISYFPYYISTGAAVTVTLNTWTTPSNAAQPPSLLGATVYITI